MQLFQNKNKIIVFCLNINNNLDIYKSIQEVLGDFDKSKTTPNKLIQIKHHYYARVLSKLIGSMVLNSNYESVIIKKTKSGKPYISKKVFLSITHSNEKVVVAFSNKNIGIDIEMVQSINHKIIDKIFSIDEKKYIRENSNEKYNYIAAWTKKEAYVKYKDFRKNIISRLKKMNTFEDKKFFTFSIDNYVFTLYSKMKNRDIQIYNFDETEMFYCIKYLIN